VITFSNTETRDYIFFAWNFFIKKSKKGEVMKRSLIVAVLIGSFILSLAGSSFAGNTGAAFLKIGAGARPSALGGNFVGLADDVNTINWNAGGLGMLKEKEMTAMYSSWLADMNYEFVAYAQPLSNNVTVGGSVVMLQSGDMDKRSDTREKLGTFTAADTCVSLAVAKKVHENASFGGTLKIINQNIDTESATGFAMDLGAIFGTSVPNLKMGVALRNIGPKMKFIDEGFNLPLTLAAGVNYSLPKVNFTSDINYFDSTVTFGVGTEYMVMNALSIDLGYKVGKDNKLAGASGISAGMSFNINKINLSYAWVPYGELSDTHRVSLGLKF
jgi:long-subunit fatty acid transport protein